MTHLHKVEKIKSQSDFENDGSGHIVVKNISGRSINIGFPAVLLYPEDEAFSCDDNPDVLSAIKSYKLEIVKTEEAREKPKKQKLKKQKLKK